ncbi:MAG: HEPN domain-containing protein [Planctomycetaceae bacterium]|jgi:HEPN domain-containing protein/predicted nucleotidyltransferase|nr:HEPN domain-containing protein [Planctomycetaceae bacterium]
MSATLSDPPQTHLEYDREEMSEIVNRLVKVYDPLRIYLFGSYAWGTPNQDSDYDLCVVVEKSDTIKKWERTIKGLDTLRQGEIRQSVDLLVFALPEFERAAAHPSTLAHPIKNRGLILYENRYDDARKNLKPEDLISMRQFYEAWLYKAESDLKLAQVASQHIPPILDGSVFHTQQCAEKALKAFLSFNRQPIHKTHKLEELIKQCAEVDSSFNDLLTEAQFLTPKVSEFRYPDSFDGHDDLSRLDPTEADTKKALNTATTILEFVKRKIGRNFENTK